MKKLLILLALCACTKATVTPVEKPVAYYRLRQVDINLDEMYSKVITPSSSARLDTGGVPITLLSFDAIRYINGDSTVIKFVTIDEHNSDYVEIEKSFDVLKWHIIARIPSRNQPTVKQTYYFTDK